MSELFIWRPRYYYIMRNVTTNKQYVGQTTQSLERYLGSGTYWKNHCKKHGGFNGKNIQIIWSQWFECEHDAQSWLNQFKEKNPDYYLQENKNWANQIEETTNDSEFVVWNKNVPKEVRAKIANTKKANGDYKRGTHTTPHTEKSKLLMSENRKGKGKQPKSAETKARMAEARRKWWENKRKCQQVNT